MAAVQLPTHLFKSQVLLSGLQNMTTSCKIEFTHLSTYQWSTILQSFIIYNTWKFHCGSDKYWVQQRTNTRNMDLLHKQSSPYIVSPCFWLWQSYPWLSYLHLYTLHHFISNPEIKVVIRSVGVLVFLNLLLHIHEKCQVLYKKLINTVF